MGVKTFVEKLIFTRPTIYRFKYFIIETVIWKWIFTTILGLQQNPLPSLLAVTNGRKVLLAGCGPGHVSTGPSVANAAEVVAFDLSLPFVESCRLNHPDWLVYCGDLLQLPHRDNEFDVVVIYSTLHHVPIDATDILVELCRVSAGKIVILEGVVPERGFLRHLLFLWYKIVDGGHRYYSQCELEQRFEKLGLCVEKKEFYSPIGHMMLVVLNTVGGNSGP